jgi:rubrerythrin
MTKITDILAPSALALAPLDSQRPPKVQRKQASTWDETAALLALAAEVEHALMLQYLYAAYSVRCDQHEPLVRNQMISLRQYLLQLAREEMGHLMTVQNLLSLIGAPLHRARDPKFDDHGLYPFHFALEPLSSRSLAKYVTAERPHYVADLELRRKLDDIAALARQANRGDDVKHLGAVYARLLELFEDPKHGLPDENFHDDTGELRARWGDWGYDETLSNQHHSRRVFVGAIDGADAGMRRKQAATALRDLMEQGEGYTRRKDDHFERFLALYDLIRELEQKPVVLTWPVAVNPTTQHAQGTTYIENKAAHAWARLSNLRYRLLLDYLHHFLIVPGPRYVQECADAEALGDHTPRGLLLRWAFDEMRHLAKISTKLVSMPLRAVDDGVRAGPPFEPNAHDGRAHTGSEPELWREHARLVALSRKLVQELMDGRRDPFLEDLQLEDEKTAPVLDALADGESIPESYHPRAFQKVAHILEQAGRGFTMEAHGNFWAGITRDEFVQASIGGRRLLGLDPSDPTRYSASHSLLPRVLERSMPPSRPTIDLSRQRFVTNWIDGQEVPPPQGPPLQGPPQEPIPRSRIGVHHERHPILDQGGTPSWVADTED